VTGFNPEQMKQLRLVFREELADAGLRLDDGDHQEEAREDFRFLRRMRRSADGVSAKVGLAVILAIVSGVVWLITQGVQVFRAANGT
jgi:hypothetical protein